MTPFSSADRAWLLAQFLAPLDPDLVRGPWGSFAQFPAPPKTRRRPRAVPASGAVPRAPNPVLGCGPCPLLAPFPAPLKPVVGLAPWSLLAQFPAPLAVPVLAGIGHFSLSGV
ncbi:hypothetical protein GCM10010326_16180 [Streptomyces xanthochromogenes]|uniref:Uncharacterized protein n=1 Tax=Streptomyces xanthochromogenes TaxID=67384 RepID=A0ABQ2ZUL5_9ACTN|nr:hypothetical protein GCM10010326_16180 [Streptomyces xanthochromogenes]